MKYRTSIFLLVAVASVFALSSMNNAEAFEPTQREMKILQKLSEIRETMERRGPDHPGYAILEEREAKQIHKLNELGVWLDGQEPSVEHLTANHTSTRQAAQAGIEPVEPEPSFEGGASGASGDCDCDKTMYVVSGYKDPYFGWGIYLYDYYANPTHSDDISSGSVSSVFTPFWRTGLNQGVIPYCQTSSINPPANAEYGLSMLMVDRSDSVLVLSNIVDKTSYFVWYDHFDRFEYRTINNLASGPTITCTISSVSVN